MSIRFPQFTGAMPSVRSSTAPRKPAFGSEPSDPGLKEILERWRYDMTHLMSVEAAAGRLLDTYQALPKEEFQDDMAILGRMDRESDELVPLIRIGLKLASSDSVLGQMLLDKVFAQISEKPHRLSYAERRFSLIRDFMKEGARNPQLHLSEAQLKLLIQQSYKTLPDEERQPFIEKFNCAVRLDLFDHVEKTQGTGRRLGRIIKELQTSAS